MSRIETLLDLVLAETLQVWRVWGDPDNQLFASKADAERAARVMFPHDTVEQRNSRVLYRPAFKTTIVPE